MFTNKYNTESVFSYADGYYAIFPKGLKKIEKTAKDQSLLKKII